jgi:glycosyltransferase involved in cell wall biosynthesis
MPPNRAPLLSVVVPTCSRLEKLSRLLDRLDAGHQGLDAGAFEVIVSDDAADAANLGQLQQRFPTIRFVTGPRKGPAANRNHGAGFARGEWLVFIDDDCDPADNWLRAIATEVGSRPLDVVEGKIVAPDKQASIFRRDVENLGGDCYWSANLTIRRHYFDALGGFDEDFPEAGGEDMEFAHRLRQLGARAAFSDAAVVSHPSHVMTVKGVLEFAFRIRWHLLYKLKTRQTLPIDAPLWKVVPYDVLAECEMLLRTSWAAAGSLWRNPQGTAVAQTALNWTLFPVMLPYKIYWDLRFRRMLTSQAARR